MEPTRDIDLRCVWCDSVNLKPFSDNLYKCLVCGKFIDNDEDSNFERIKQHKGRND